MQHAASGEVDPSASLTTSHCLLVLLAGGEPTGNTQQEVVDNEKGKAGKGGCVEDFQRAAIVCCSV